MRRRIRSRYQFAFLPSGCHRHSRDFYARRDAFDELIMGKCPRCGGPLVARVNRFGPYFYCLCLERRAA
jgi:hypothetical protein